MNLGTFAYKHPVVQDALLFAIEAHGEQRRKYTNEPYYTHPMAVAQLVLDALEGDELFAPDLPEIVAAALLHDVLEDTPETQEALRIRFGSMVADLVVELTDVFVPAPGTNRAERKMRERERLRVVSMYAQTIKVADLLHNMPSIVQHDPQFAPRFIDEKYMLLAVLTRANPKLREAAHAMLRAYALGGT